MDMVASSTNLSGTAWTTYGVGTDWSGANAPAVGAGALVTDIRAVAVPASSGDPLWNGYCPGTGYLVGDLAVQATALAGGEEVVTIRMGVALLKITRVGDPTGTPIVAPEMVSFGYDAGGSPDTVGSGSDTNFGDTEGIDDATVIIRKKGDFGSFDPNSGTFLPVPDGAVQIAELPNWLAAVGTSDPLQLFLGDFGQFDPNSGEFSANPDCDIVIAELPNFLAAVGS